MFKNVKKEDLITVLTELGESVNNDMKVIDLKQKLLKNEEYLQDKQFVEDFLASTVEDRKTEENRKIEELRLQREHELELARIQTTRSNGNESAFSNANSGEEITLDKLIKGVEILTIPVPRKTESWNLFFDSLERAFKHKKVPEEFQAEILLKLLGDKASNVLVYIQEEDFKDYSKVKDLILKEFQPSAQTCRKNFEGAKRNPGESHKQFASRLTSTWEYYCKLRKVEDFASLKDLIISDKLFQALDSETASHIALRQGEEWLKPQELAKECDIYFGAKQNSLDDSRSETRKPFPSDRYVPPHQRKEMPKRDNGSQKQKQCFSCGSYIHLAKECPDKRKRNEFVPEESEKNFHGNSNINQNKSHCQEAVVAKVDSSHLQAESTQNMVTPLKKISIYIDSKEIEATVDSGTQISIIHSSLVPDLQKKEGSKILLTPAFGEPIEAKATHIVERVNIPPVSRKTAKRPRTLKARHFVYRTVEDTDLTDPPDLHVVLTSYVEGIGDVGDVISADTFYAREHLLLPRKADYATPENIEKFTNMKKSRSERAKYSSIQAGMLVKILSRSTIPVFMNNKESWTIEKKHIHVAFRVEGFHVPEEAIELPSTPIEGPDLEKESTDFAVYVTINDTERVPVRCRLFHVKPGLETAKLSDEMYLDKYEPVLPEQKELLESMPMPEILDNISASVSLVEKYRIRYIN